MKRSRIRATMGAVRESGIPFGSYLLLRRLARGGMAEVFLARQRGPGGFERRVALKRILPHLVDSEDFVHMFLEEARLAAGLTHSNIVHIYEFGKVDEHYFIAMEYVDGVHAGALIERGPANRVPPALVARIGADACTGLNYAHHAEDESGRPMHLVHRDISPPNIMVSFDGAVKLVDFGIAKAVSSVERTRPGVVKGKFAYMSPEQTMNKKLDGRSDVFSLSLILWELLAGRVAVSRDDPVFAMQSIRDGKVPPVRSINPEVPPLLSDIIDTALCVRPEDRPGAAELGSALEGFIKSSPELGTSLQLSQWIRRRFRQGSGPLPVMADIPVMMQAIATGAGRAPTAQPGRSPAPAASKDRAPVPAPLRQSTPATVVAALHSAPMQSAADEITERTGPPRMSTPQAQALMFALPEQPDEATERTAPPIIPTLGPTLGPAPGPTRGPAPGPGPGPAPLPAYPRMEPARRPSSISLPVTASEERDDNTDPTTEVVREPQYTQQPELGLGRPASVSAWLGPYDRRRRGRRIAITAILTIVLAAAAMLALAALRAQSSDTESRPAPEATPAPPLHLAPPAPPAPAARVQDAGAGLAKPAPADAGSPPLQADAPEPAPADAGPPPPQADAPEPAPVRNAAKQAPLGDNRTEPRKTAAASVPEPDPSGTSRIRRGNGTLTVVTQPYSNVYLGKTKLGTTPLANVTLPAGAHVLTFRSPGYPAATRSVTIRPGRTTKLKFSLAETK